MLIVANGGLEMKTNARLRTIFGAFLIPLLFVGCATSAKKQLAASEALRDSLEKDRASLSRSLVEEQESLRRAHQQIRRLSDQLDRLRQEASVDRRRCRDDIVACHNEVRESREDFEACWVRKEYLENADVGQLSEWLNSCRAESPDLLKQGFQLGRLEVLDTISISGVTEVAPKYWGLSRDYFYVFEVEVEGRKFFFHKVRVCEEQGPVVKSLGAIGGLAPLILNRVPKL